MRTTILRLMVTICVLAAAVFAQAPAGGGQRGPAVPPMRLMNSSWADAGVIPQKYAGAMGVSPALSWTNVPMGTMSFVLLMHDPDGAPMRGSADVLHWLAINIPGTTTMIPEGWSTA